MGEIRSDAFDEEPPTPRMDKLANVATTWRLKRIPKRAVTPPISFEREPDPSDDAA